MDFCRALTIFGSLADEDRFSIFDFLWRDNQSRSLSYLASYLDMSIDRLTPALAALLEAGLIHLANPDRDMYSVEKSELEDLFVFLLEDQSITVPATHMAAFKAIEGLLSDRPSK